ncbi:IS200/IS605 family transposase [Streptomyces mirabilis]|uniref:IS200/IS605 family transposase n=1 Tax=Streptomyces mirabilis TaxID=68239 RepID=UPI00368B85A8
MHRGRSVVCSLHAHLVFTPKYRRGPFTDEILTRCEEIMRDVCADFGAELHEFNGEEDRVHLPAHYPPKIALSRLVGSLKGVSARRLRQEFPDHIRRYLWGDHFWSPRTRHIDGDILLIDGVALDYDPAVTATALRAAQAASSSA